VGDDATGRLTGATRVSPLRRSAARVRRVRRNVFQVRLPDEERRVLRALCAELRDLLARDDRSTVRLFPPAYGDDQEASAQFADIVHDDLVAGHIDAMQTVESTLDATQLDEEQLTAWLGALNDLRLVLGTRLNVTEDLYERGVPPNDPQAPQLALYEYLGWLEEGIVQALGEGLDPAGSEPT
jgi:hypothetical protein